MIPKSAQLARILTVCSADVSLFPLFAPLRCTLTPILRGVLGKMAVPFYCQTDWGGREQTHE
jgi:hypothetical protein